MTAWELSGGEAAASRDTGTSEFMADAGVRTGGGANCATGGTGRGSGTMGAADGSALKDAKRRRGEGNPDCFVCRRLHCVPFGRCRACRLGGAYRCPTLRVALLAGMVDILCVVAAIRIGDLFSHYTAIAVGILGIAVLVCVDSIAERGSDARVLAERLNGALSRQREFFEELSPLTTLEHSLQRVVREVAERVKCRRVSIMLVNEESSTLYIAASVGIPEEIVLRTRIPLGEQVCGSVFRSGRSVHVSDVTAGGRSRRLPVAANAFMAEPLMLSGLRWRQASLGVLSVTEPVGRADFSREDEDTLVSLGQVAAIVIHNERALDRARRAQVDLLETLVKAIEAKDIYTRGHSERVCAYSLAIGRRLGLEDHVLANLRVAARLHDLGKIGIPDAVLNKPSKLTEEEMQIVREHPSLAVEMLSKASLLAPVLRIIEGHHERPDGNGYPRQAAGGDIPLLSQIISTADVFDAVTSARPYREPLNVSDALAEMQRGRGTQFAEACLDALTALVEEGTLPGLEQIGSLAPEGVEGAVAV